MARRSSSTTSAASTANGQIPGPANTEGTSPSATTITPVEKTSTAPDDESSSQRFKFEPFTRRHTHRTPASVPYDSTLLPTGSRSLTSISLQSFSLGFTLAFCLLLILYLLLELHDPIWRFPAFFASLSVFHFLEFYTTARYNLPAVRASSFLLFNNGRAYNIAHSCAALEMLLWRYAFPGFQAWPIPPVVGVSVGLMLVIMGQTVRSVAMAQAGTNFNHTPVQQRTEGHVLVTRGVYAWSRHPSYFGFFWWALGTQVLVGNKVCLVGYAVALWRFFWVRIRAEERTLLEFFGDDYREYRKRVRVLIPFIR